MTDLRTRFEQEALPHIDAAYNLARWLARSDADAEDVVQEALLLAYRNFERQRGPSTKAWLLAIVRNCFLSSLRRSAPRARLTDPLEAFGDGAVPAALVSAAVPERDAIAADRARTLDAALGGLSEDYREVLVLRELEGLSYREIAEVTATPIGTVMSRLARARTAFRVLWCGAGGGSSDGVS
jgi:RNA polymerase sigma-70 factor (ECF subfamily)